MRSVLPALRFLRPYPLAIAGASIALILTASVTLSVGQGMRVLIDDGLTQGATPELLASSLLLVGGLIFLLAIGTFVRFYLVSWVGERVSADIRKAVFSHLVTLSPAYFEANPPAEIQSRLTTDTLLLQTVLGSSVSIALRNILMFGGGVVLMLLSNPRLTLLVLLCVPLVVAPIIIFGRLVRRLSRQSQDRIADLGAYAGETLRHLKTVQAFTHEAVDVERFHGHVDRALEVAVTRIWYRALLITLVMMLVLGAIAVMVWVGGHDVLVGRTSPGELGAFLFYALVVAGSTGALSEVVSDLQRAAGATERLLELLDERSSVVVAPAPAPLPEPPIGAVAFEDVSFRYPSRPDVEVLHGVSLAVEPGETVALVGPSGAGKSTMFDLLLRFYDPSAGVIRVDGLDLRSVDPQALRRRVAIVAQRPGLFSGTVFDNVAYGFPGADRAAVRSACATANALDFIEALPAGFDTRLGEDGVGLSGGQLQRLAIARAVLTDPAVLLLDEATSALDADSEQLIQEALGRVTAQRTTLIIAHRLATVRGADRIAVLEEGSLVAQGTHDSLLQSSPLYARLAHLQFGASAGSREQVRQVV